VAAVRRFRTDQVGLEEDKIALGNNRLACLVYRFSNCGIDIVCYSGD